MAVVTTVSRGRPAAASARQPGTSADWAQVQRPGFSRDAMPRSNYRKPLSPFADADDDGRYQPIDDFEAMFRTFRHAFGDPRDWTRTAHLIVVTGDRGCGKTSLIQRCAYWLKSQDQSACTVTVLDLTEQPWQSDSRDRRMTRIFDRIKYVLAPQVSESAMTLISPLDRANRDLTDDFFYLGEALRSGAQGDSPRPIALVVLLPALRDSHVAEEIRQYHELACPGIFFFAEVLTDGDPGKAEGYVDLGVRARSNVHLLVAGSLKDGDVSLLVDFIRREQGPIPEIPDEIIESIAADKASAAEITFATHGVLEIARHESAQRVTTAHLLAYYQQFFKTFLYGDEGS
jgi:hypothetical protein